jgi:hypothetical protein
MAGRIAATLAATVLLGIATGAHAQVTVSLNGTAGTATQTSNNQLITVSVTGAPWLIFRLPVATGGCA